MKTSIELVTQHFPDQTPAAAALLVKTLHKDAGMFALQYLEAVKNGEKQQRNPFSVEMIAPPSGCAQACLYCSAEARSERVVTGIELHGRETSSPGYKKDAVIAVVDELAGLGTRGAIWSGGGDWCVYPWITNVLEHAFKNGFENNFWISHFAAREFSPKEAEQAVTSCTSIRASVDGPDIETYNAIRRPFNKKAFYIMKKNVQAFVEARARTGSEVRIGIQMLLLPINIDKIEEMFALAQELGVDYLHLRPVEPTGEHYDDAGKPVGIHSYSQHYEDLSIFDQVAEICARCEEKYGVKALYRADKVADIKETGLDTKPARPAEHCDGALLQAVIQFDLSFRSPELLHCYYRDDLAMSFTPGHLTAALFSQGRQSLAEEADRTPHKCSKGCKYVTCGLNMAFQELRAMTPAEQIVTVQALIAATADIKLQDPYII